MYFLICASNEDSSQPAHPRNPIRVRCPHGEILNTWIFKMRPANIQISMRECACWSESSLGAHGQRYDFWRWGSNDMLPYKINTLQASWYEVNDIEESSYRSSLYLCWINIIKDKAYDRMFPLTVAKKTVKKSPQNRFQTGTAVIGKNSLPLGTSSFL